MPGIFIDPLPPDFTSGDLGNLLRPFGSVLSVKVICDSLGYSLRFGQAEMETDEGVNEVCKGLHGRKFQNAILTVLRADELKESPAD
jgi:RNA recognition motif-containing protein